MTMRDERTRALLWAGGLLLEVARDSNLSLALRRRAVVIARHFPTIEDVSSMAIAQQSSGFGLALALPEEVTFSGDYRYGPLRYSSRLRWPNES